MILVLSIRDHRGVYSDTDDFVSVLYELAFAGQDDIFTIQEESALHACLGLIDEAIELQWNGRGRWLRWWGRGGRRRWWQLRTDGFPCGDDLRRLVRRY